ncbi:aromatic amino acid lyase [Leptospira yanagawae serovar Saopaulo str. Sao Paulo = ATCC 700523]|uniref:Aromatic amino acid lyase n=1 Tax=Leptospira yanagawae serovar Saopaulo str. Sao Paulo = ATCC 700523 TaxID=1249483 RepID=A0A5E8HED3_9LEPT|nr:aromatic amino acid ammonia-lyase [Leptospira yanagawae]EOQ89831.1 aromatic amino acid lyase [Leptospira yanagawae serovar Saopaulo str. Sao Paulo = ATCC 700523]
MILHLSQLDSLSRSGSFSHLTNHKDSLQKEREELESILKTSKEKLIYGIHTGFGPHAFTSNEELDLIQKSLIYHLTVEPVLSKEGIPHSNLTHEEARVVLSARIYSLSLGGSGIRYETLELLNQLLELDCIPILPEKGSLSASGDLIPLSYIPLALLGESGFTGKGKELGPTKLNGKSSKIPGLPWTPHPKEAISLTNGTSFTTALLGYQVVTFRNFFLQSVELLQYLFHYHSVFPDAFHPSYHNHKQFSGPKLIAKFLHPIVSKNPKLKVEGKRIQDIYSIRCIPQILGAVWDEMESIGSVVEQELNSLSDNPVLIPLEGDHEFRFRFAEGGGFYASQVSFAADRLQNAMAVWCTWVDRFLNYLFDPKENDEFPLMLSAKPGTFAGLSGLGLMSAHLTAEVRRDSMPGSMQSIPTNGNNQDIVPMGAISVLRNRRTMTSVTKLLAIVSYAVYQTSLFAKRKELVPDSELFRGLKTMDVDRSLDFEIQTLIDRISNSTSSLVTTPID